MQSRALVVVSVLVSLLTAYLVAKYEQAKTASLLVTKEILLVDENKRPRIHLHGGSSGAAAIEILAEDNGAPRIQIGIPVDGSSNIQINDSSGHTRIKLALTGDMALLSLNFPDSKRTIVLGDDSQGRSALLFTDAQGDRRASLGLDGRQNPAFVMYDDKDNVTWLAPDR